VSVSAHVEALKGHICPHYPPDETGDPFFDIRGHLKRVEEPAAPFWRRAWRAVSARLRATSFTRRKQPKYVAVVP
jgi:hypothetical protein